MKRRILFTTVCGAIALYTLPALSNSLHSSMSAFSAEDCAPVVRNELHSLGLKKRKVLSTQYITIWGGGEKGTRVDGYEVWVNLKTCDGSIVLQMDNACTIQREYATRNCVKVFKPKE